MTTKAAAIEQREALEHWRERNPLLLWRKRHKFTMADVTGMAGVSFSSVQLWQNGSNTPTSESIEKLANMMDITPANLLRMWNAWLEERP